MDDILEEASAVVQCKTCPWYKNCVTPIKLSIEDLQRQLRTLFSASTLPSVAGDEMRLFLESVATTLQNIVLEGCPVFVSRLRQSPRLAQTLKQIMQKWGTGTETQEQQS